MESLERVVKVGNAINMFAGFISILGVILGISTIFVERSSSFYAWLVISAIFLIANGFCLVFGSWNFLTAFTSWTITIAVAIAVCEIFIAAGAHIPRIGFFIVMLTCGISATINTLVTRRYRKLKGL